MEVVSQLAYARDCLLFLKASVKEVHTIKGTLSSYCNISGQKVNMEKSSIFFGVAAVDMRLRRES